MIYQIMQNGLPFWQNAVLLLSTVITVAFSLSLHEWAHGFVSYAQGDFTAKQAGRLTINPMKHLDLVGTVCMLFAGVGWAKPVPVDVRYYKNKKRGMALTGLAGPLMNFIIGINATVAVSVLTYLWETNIYKGFYILKYMTAQTYETVSLVLYIVLYYNILFAIFNMLPIPPFDGSRVLLAVFPDKLYFEIMKYERIIVILLFLALWGGMFTGVFEAVADAVVKGVATLVYSVLELTANIVVKILK